MRQFFSFRRNRAALRRLGRRLQSDGKGVAAVEFALIWPVMILLYYGIVEVGRATMADRRVTQLNRALVDLASQSPAISDGERDMIFLIGQMILAPETMTSTPPPPMPATLKMIIASVVVDDKGVAKVCWSAPINTTAPPANIKLPAGLLIPKTSLIMAEASYGYKPLLGDRVVKGALTLGGNRIYMRPRAAAKAGPLNIEQVARITKINGVTTTITC
ncbi:TadE/TadG family type IV pilus assembly protein [Bosea sp. 2YAB26]|uniref:TadE/TadG family type IV pilus assembly protein n=1 Tax=Bosea sp. 2YAB26 TaxID=3237478 RepID=UPI003F935D95